MLNAAITGKDKSGNRISYPVESFDKPLMWESFKGYPIGFQRLYIEKLREKYNVTQAKIAEMFGIHFSTFSKYCSDSLKIVFKKHRMSVAEKEAFAAFCSTLEEKRSKIAKGGDSAYGEGSKNQIKVAEEMSSETKKNQNVCEFPIVIGDDAPKYPDEDFSTKTKEYEQNNKQRMRRILLDYDGEIDLVSVFKTLRWLIREGDNASMHIEVNFE